MRKSRVKHEEFRDYESRTEEFVSASRWLESIPDLISNFQILDFPAQAGNCAKLAEYHLELWKKFDCFFDVVMSYESLIVTTSSESGVLRLESSKEKRSGRLRTDEAISEDAATQFNLEDIEELLFENTGSEYFSTCAHVGLLNILDCYFDKVRSDIEVLLKLDEYSSLNERSWTVAWLKEFSIVIEAHMRNLLVMDGAIAGYLATTVRRERILVLDKLGYCFSEKTESTTSEQFVTVRQIAIYARKSENTIRKKKSSWVEANVSPAVLKKGSRAALWPYLELKPILETQFPHVSPWPDTLPS